MKNIADKINMSVKVDGKNVYKKDTPLIKEDLPCGGIRLKFGIGNNDQKMEIEFSEYTNFEEAKEDGK